MRYQPELCESPDPTLPRSRVLIVGGSLGGMATGLALARAGHDVTIVERDPVDDVPDAETAFGLPRRGVPHTRQTHGLLARLTGELRRRFPDILDDLLAQGAYESRSISPAFAPVPEDAELSVLLVRRTTLDWVLRRATLRQSGLHWLGDGVAVGFTGTPASGDDPAVVTGVRLDDGTELHADLVIGCTGRRTDLAAWLAPLAVELDEVVHETNLVYLTRWYRLRAGTELVMNPKLTGDLRYLKYLAVPGDGNTFAVTIAVRTDDDELRRSLLDPDNFDRAAAALDGVGDVFATHAPEPIGRVEPMGGLTNRLRHFLTGDGRPKVLRFHAVGDAHTCTNPFYGRGCSMTLVQSLLLADAVLDHQAPAERSIAYERACAEEIEPWFHHSVQLDSVLNPESLDEPDTADVDPSIAALRLLITASVSDAVIHRAFMRVFNLLSRPDELAQDPAFAMRVAEILSNPDAVPPAPPVVGPTRAELLQSVAV